MSEAKIRLYVDQPLAPGQAVALGADQANYLFNVMRLTPGAAVKLFNGRDGEMLATVEIAAKRHGALRCDRLLAPLTPPPDLWLVFAPIKKARLDFLVEKAVELGVARLVPVQTRHTTAERLRPDKMRAHVIEAAEQCEATHLPDIAPLTPLDTLLAQWPADRRLFWADEGRAAQPTLMAAPKGQPAAILIGPEGGFSADERAKLTALPFVTPLSLGPRILRTETAAIAALTLFQATLGDWT